MNKPAVSPGHAGDVILLDSSCFFVRRVPLVCEGNALQQVELVLEGISPFPLDQLHHGCLVAPDGDEALVFAASRRQFDGAEEERWRPAAGVFPAFIALLWPAAAPVIRVWAEADTVTVAAWDKPSSFPAVILSRLAGPGARDTLVADARARVGNSGLPVEEVKGAAEVAPRAGGRGFDFAIGPAASGRTFLLPAKAAATADVRDREFLAGQRRTATRDRWLWRGLQAGLVTLVVLLVAELGLFAAAAAVRSLQAKIQARTAAVERIATAQSLGERIGELGRRRLAPLEMLALLNRPRPASIAFSRATTDTALALEVDAQTPNAADVGVYEAALRSMPELASVETRDLRSRDGVTSFSLAVTFHAAALEAEGGK